MRQKGLSQFHLVDLVFIAYLLILSILILFSYPRIPCAACLLVAHGAGIAFLILVARVLRRKSPFVQSCGRIAFVAATLPLAFSELGILVHTVNPNDQELLLIQIDYLLLGVNPTQFLQAVTVPLLTEILQIIYSTFYFLPMVLGVFLIAKKRVREMNITLLAVVAGFFLSYLGYFLVPALPPYRVYELHGVLPHSVPLEGLWLATPIRNLLDSLEKIKRDCFPSGHTEVSLVVLCLAFRFDRRAFAILLPIIVSLIFSTVYLRYHYVIDVIAGVLLALPVITLSPRVYEWWERKRSQERDFSKIL